MRVLLVALTLLLLSSCAQPPSTSEPAPAEPAPTAPAPVAGFNATDTAWLQLMISMDKNLAALLDLAPDRGGPALRDTATALRAEVRAQLKALEELRVAAGIPDTDIHAGHAMPGMVTDAALVVMRDSDGAEFDRELRRLAGAHLDQTVLLADGVRKAGESAAVRELAEGISVSAPAQRSLLENATS
ncbi:DUF305 domain-containing protein [Actinokineospora sp. 24-640]